MKTGHPVTFCFLIIAILILISVVLQIGIQTWQGTTGESPVVDKSTYKKIYHLTTEVQDEWDEVLRTAPIKQIVSEGYVGLATKYLVIFETGHIAIAKVVEPFSLVDHDWETISYEDADRYSAQATTYSRSGRKFQAWTEVAAYIVSRIGFPYAKKPPAMIRAIPSSLLYQCEGCNSWREYFYSWILPEHTVYISVHAYLNSMRISAPSVSIMEYLTHTPIPHNLNSVVCIWKYLFDL